MLSQALPQLGLCPFLKLSALLIRQVFIEHLLLYLCLCLHLTRSVSQTNPCITLLCSSAVLECFTYAII